jgi:hypothetical protein
MRERDGRLYLYTRIPTDIAFRNWLAALIFGGLTIWEILSPNYGRYSEYELWKFSLSTDLVLFLGASVQVYINKGYRLSYDREAIYFRPDGVTWKLTYRDDWVLRFEDIDKLIAECGQSNIQPFEFINLWRTTWDGVERFFVSRIFLKDAEIKEFLHFLFEKRPDIFPQDVIDYMNADQPL